MALSLVRISRRGGLENCRQAYVSLRKRKVANG